MKTETMQTNDIANTLPLKLVFNLQEAADIIGVNPDTVRRMVKDGKLRKLPLRHVKISAVELNRFLAEGARP